MSSQHKHNAQLSRDPNIAVQEVMDSINILSTIYIQENAALNDADTQAFLSLQEQKFAMARTYQVRVEGLLKRKDELKEVTPQKKEQLKKMQTEFSELTEKNKDALARMERCLVRIGESVRNIAKDAVNKQRGINYGECGTIKNTDHKSVSTGVNETV